MEAKKDIIRAINIHFSSLLNLPMIEVKNFNLVLSMMYYTFPQP